VRAQLTGSFLLSLTFSDKVTEFGLKLMAIDSEKLGIPETSYAASVKMPAPEFQRIVSSMAALGDSSTFNSRPIILFSLFLWRLVSLALL
jgi:hypothetical protein